MLKLLLGKTKTGKSKYIMDLMDEDNSKMKNVILFVPSQMRMLAEEKYMATQKKKGILNIDFTTISEFVSNFLEKCKDLNSYEYLDKIDKKIIIHKLITENDDILEMFKKSKYRPGFAGSMQIYMDLFRKNEISKEDVLGLEKSENVLLQTKLKEIYALYEKYIEMVNKKYVDSISEMDMFLEKYNVSNDYISNTKMYFDSYNNFTKSEQKFIMKMASLGFDITIAITSDIFDMIESTEKITDINYVMNTLTDCENGSRILGSYNLTAVNIIKEAKTRKIDVEVEPFLERKDLGVSSDIKLLSDKLFFESANSKEKIKSEDIHVLFANNMYSEVESLAKKIKSMVISGKRYNDFAIYVSSLEEYKDVIKNTFINYNMPVHLDMKSKLTSNILYKYIYGILNMTIYSLDLKNLMDILKLRMLDISFEDISYFENYALEFGITSEYKLKRNIEKCGNYDIERLNNVKKSSIDVFLKLKENLLKIESASEIISAIYNHLEGCNVLKNLERITNFLEENENTEIRYIGSLNSTAFDSILSIFNSIEKIYSEGKISIKKFTEILKSISSDITIKSVPSAMDEIEVLDINVSKIMPRDVVFFLGVNEGKMPLEIKEDMIFSDRDITLLEKEYNISFREDSFSKLMLQRYNIYEAINSAKKQIYMYYLGLDLSGKSLRKSDIITDVLNIFDIKVEDVNVSTLGDACTNRDLLEKLNSNVRNLKFDEETFAIYEALAENEKYKNVLEYIRNSDNISKETLGSIYKSESVNSSISRLEQFKRCPFSYYVKYLLKVDERKMYKITSLDIGSFMHSAIEKFSKYLFENKIYFYEILLDKEKYEKIIEDIACQTLESQLYMHKENIKYDILKRKLTENIKKAIFVIAKGFEQSKFLPYAYELEFGNSSTYHPIEVKLSDTKVMRLVGKIDRVDVAKVENEEYVRIVDYKSSSKDLDIDDVKEGISLQLITYLSAFIDSNKEKNMKPAGVMYFNLIDKFTKINDLTLSEEKIKSETIKGLRMKGIFLKDMKVLEIMDKNIENSERLINVSSRSVKSDAESKSLLNEEEFKSICIQIKDILRDIGKQMIIDGKTSIEPNKKLKPCDNCKYAAICRKNNMC